MRTFRATTPRAKSIVLGAALSASLALTACGSEDPEPATDSIVGRSELSEDGLVRVEIVAAEPSVPLQGDNAWTVAVFDGDETPIVGAEVIGDIYMPAHDHSVRRLAEETSPGTYELNPIPLTMPGTWEITLDVTLAEPPDTVAEVLFVITVPD